MELPKVPVSEILKWDQTMVCFYCGTEADKRPGHEDWTIREGKIYCPECAAHLN